MDGVNFLYVNEVMSMSVCLVSMFLLNLGKTSFCLTPLHIFSSSYIYISELVFNLSPNLFLIDDQNSYYSASHCPPNSVVADS